MQIQNLEKELEEQKLLAAKRWNKIVDAEDLRQENNLLQSKNKDQQTKMEALEVKVKGLENDLKVAKESEKKINLLHEQIDKLRLEKKSLEIKMRELQLEYEQKQRTTTINKRDNDHMEEKLNKVFLNYCKVGNFRYIHDMLMEREILINYITHTVHINSLYL